MQKGQVAVGMMGMNQDMINQKVNSQQAFEIKNFRINPTGHSNGIELTTEKGTKTVSIMVYQSEQEESENRSVQHEQDFPWWYECPIIGHCVINEHLVLFMKGGATYQDRIVHLELMDDGGNKYFLIRNEGSFYGDLDFDEEYKIEAIASYESEDIIKVYWIDGKNHPRVINIMQDYDYPNVQTYDPFSFYQSIIGSENNSIAISKQYTGGLFYAGVIQYAISFYNKNAQETPIVYATPLNYISNMDNAEAQNEQLGCSFSVTVKINQQCKQRFEYIRVYSIYRSSINGNPVVKVINDIRCSSLDSQNQCTFIDTNEQGYDFDAYRILIQNEHIVPNAISYKDKKMFMANFNVEDNNLNWDSFMGQSSISWSNKKQIHFNEAGSTNVYQYKNQLQSDSSSIKIFKQNEYYKLGIQFQDKYGKWSEPFILGTYENTGRITMNSNGALVPIPTMEKSIQWIKTRINTLYPGNEYINVRAVASFPTISERKILCQGIINPAVFNIRYRKNGTCRAQSSWFFRPFVPAGVNNQVQNGFGFAEYHGNRSLYGSDDPRCEIQCMYYDQDYYDTEIGQNVSAVRPKKTYAQIQATDGQKYDHCYFVDTDYYTLNSPDIEFDQNVKNVDISQYDKIEFQGIVKFNNVASRYNIVASSPLFLNTEFNSAYVHRNYYLRSSKMAIGFYDKTYSYSNGQGQCFGKMCLTRNMWFDDICNILSEKRDDEFHAILWNHRQKEIPYAVYPWQRQYLNNYNNNNFNIGQPGAHNSEYCDITREQESSKIIRKVLSNMRFCTTQYCNQHLSIDGLDEIKIYDSNENQFLKFGNEMYYGNVDQLVTCNSEYTGWHFLDANLDSGGIDGPIQFDWGVGGICGYPIIADERRICHTATTNSWPNYMTVEGYASNGTNLEPYDLTGPGLNTLKPLGDMELTSDGETLTFNRPTPNVSSQDPISIRYKSAPHAVLKFDNFAINQTASGVDFDAGYLRIVDICRDDSNLPYRNDTKFDVLQRVWIPCSDPMSLDEQGTHVSWQEGNAFLQRYDCLKTYPFSSDDYQSVVEIASFIVETYVNIDGRYDNNRGLLDNTHVNPSNFNLINNVYSQQNNFFNYNQLDDQAFKTHDFPTRFTWSLDKINGQEIDEWTRTNTAAFYDCDGDKGQITSLRRFNNQIYAFQEKGISRIKYNENAIINTENGTPIELGNSATVNGVDYVSEMVGSQNKWSCISTPVGIFFVDNYTPGIYRLGGGKQVLTCLTDNCMQRWFEQRNGEWFINTVSYDGNMNETIFTYGDEGNENSIVYNNDYEIFSSFYDYQGVIGNIKSHSFNIHSNNIYFLREGNAYNMFYGSTKPYWITFVANPTSESGPNANCIFDNVWYNADVVSDTNEENMNYDELIEKAYDTIPRFHGYTTTSSVHSKWYETFNVIEAGNDYQYGIFEKSSQYSYTTQTKYFEFIKKFRTWRVPVPRSQRNAPESQRPFVNLNRDRMRGQWLRIKLENDNPSTDKMILRDILVDVLN